MRKKQDSSRIASSKGEGAKRDVKIQITAVSENFEIRAETLRLAMKAMGHEVTVLTTDYLHVRKEKRTEPKEDYVFLPTRPYARNLSVARMRSHVALSREIFQAVRRDLPDLVWVLVPPNTYARDAVRLKQEYPQVRIVLDIVDLWPESLPIGKIKEFFPFTLWRDRRDRSFPLADAIVTECDLYQQVLAGALKGLHPTTLYLAREERPFHPALSLPEDRLSLCYLGSINHIVDTEGIAALIREAGRRAPVQLHVMGDGEGREDFLRRCGEAGAEVLDHGSVYDPDRKQAVFDQCHYGLNMMKSTVRVGLTMKSIDYLEGGLPLINNLSGDTRDLIRSRGFGINIGEEPLPGVYDPGMREEARRFFEERLTLQVFTRELREILKKVAPDSGNGNHEKNPPKSP